MKIDRLIGILSLLLQRDSVTAVELAERFEVSRRTITRDIESLSMAGIPIVTRQGRGGGISIMDGYRMDRTLFNREEMRAILTGLRSLDSVSGTDRYLRLMDKLQADASLVPAEEVLIDLSSFDRDGTARGVELIQGAIHEKRLLHFSYSAPDADTVRTVEPYYLLFRWSGWYMYGYCLLRGDFRLFKLRRMTEVYAGENFVPRPCPYPELSDEQIFSHNFVLTARIQLEKRWRVLEEFGTDALTPEPGGTFLFSFGFTDRAQAVSFALSFEDGMEVLSPQWVREELADFGERLQQRYRCSAASCRETEKDAASGGAEYVNRVHPGD